MIKLLMALTVFTSLSAQAAVVLYGKVEGHECIIKDERVVNTVNFQKGKLSLTTSKSILSKGLDAFARQALSAATEREVMSGVAFTVEVDGVKANLKLEDSPEAAALIGFISKACF